MGDFCVWVEEATYVNKIWVNGKKGTHR
jgi:hypothetical protein